MLRDSVFYGMSLVCFVAFSLNAKIEVWEASILLILYMLYILIMKFNGNLMAALEKW